eukprot:3530153-Amphidinium_carterae.2
MQESLCCAFAPLFRVGVVLRELVRTVWLQDLLILRVGTVNGSALNEIKLDERFETILSACEDSVTQFS